MKKILIVLLLVFIPVFAHAGQVNVLLYCNARAPVNGDEHWKSEIPDIGAIEVIRNFRLIASQGSKRFYHAVIEKNETNTAQFTRIKNYISNYNIGKAIQDQILYWHGPTALDAYRALWIDRTTAPFIEAIAKKIIQYPIRALTGNEDHPVKASIEDAENLYGLTIENSVLLECGARCIPHRFFGM